MNATKIKIKKDESIGVINPCVHGHFIEHLGSCVYDGIWVGRDSKIRNYDGIRADAVDMLKAISPPVFRWPGGCFADQYDWKDGIGANRAKRVTNRWGADEVESNHFGTHEFINFCNMINAMPWLNGNVSTGTPREMRDWAEYCNFPGGTELSDLRKKNGSQEPFNVVFWGVGNEAWDCGGKFTPQDYAGAYRRFESCFPKFYDKPATLIACGPDGNKPYERVKWTREFFSNALCWRKPRIGAYDVHFYTWNSMAENGTATEFTKDEYDGLITTGMEIEGMLLEQWAIMEEYDPLHKIPLIIGEWGAWHPSDVTMNIFCQQNTLRDAALAGITLNIFQNHCDKIMMANLAQTFNVLQSLFLTDGDKIIKTPTYHIFDMYQQHKGATALRAHCNDSKLSISVSLSSRGMTLTIVNADCKNAKDLIIDAGEDISAVMSKVLESTDLSAHNTFEEPNAVEPCDGNARINGDKKIETRIKPGAIISLHIK